MSKSGFFLKTLSTTGALLVFASVSLYAASQADSVDNRWLPVPDKLPAPLLCERRVSPIPQYSIPVAAHHPTGLTGIDVSHYQGNIEWSDVAGDANVRFAYVKATEASTLRDSHLERNLRGARAAGIPVGVYHFFSPTAPVNEQLRNFLGSVRPQDTDLIPIIDVEKRGRAPLATFNSRLRTFLQQVEEAYGVKPVIYTGMNFYNRYLVGQFTQYKFMIASYSEDIPQLLDEPRMVLWQFTAEGSVAGVRTHVDRSRFMDRYTLSDILLRP